MTKTPLQFGKASVLRVLLLLIAFSWAVSSHAATRCIEDVTQVQSVMDAAMVSAETLEDVRLKEGSYNFTTGDWGYFGVLQGTGKTLQITGGWSGGPGVCTSRTNNVGATILWGLGQRKVLGINASTTFTGSVVIENLSIGGGFTNVNASGMCLGLGEQNGGVMGIRVERVWISNCTAPTVGVDAPAVSLVSSISLIARNNIIAANTPGVGVTFSTAIKGGVAYILNNTIVDNTSANVNGFIGFVGSASNGATMTVANNLFDLNTATAATRYDIRLGPGVTLQNNRYTGLSGVPDSNTGSSTGPGGFLSGTYDLAGDSTAIDTGAFFVSLLQGTFDIAGRPRVYGPAVDLGAFEFTIIYSDGFEDPENN